MLPFNEVQIDPIKINNIGLGKSIYTKKQLEEFARFQDSQGTRRRTWRRPRRWPTVEATRRASGDSPSARPLKDH
jgi:hypothetical protein